MKNEMFKTPNVIQYVDESCNLILPWYTKPCLDSILKMDYKKWDVFEWGGGCSTVWYSMNCKSVDTLENDTLWANEISSYLDSNGRENYTMKVIECPMSANSYHPNQEAYLKYIDSLDKKWDCIIIDGSFRSDALQVSEKYIKKGGILIFDNYCQDTSGYPDLPNKDYFNSKYKHDIFVHPEREYWKTAIWYINN